MMHWEPFTSIFLLLILHFLSSGNIKVQACTFYVQNKCPFPIWPATASNQGHPVIANGGFYLPPGKLKTINARGDWSGRFWARTGCNFNSNSVSKHKAGGCETGDCGGGRLECNGTIGLPPATLVEFSLQVDKSKPSFYDVSLVDGYNLPVSVTTKSPNSKCLIKGCLKDMKSMCPQELQVLNGRGEIVACKSACLAFNHDSFCCRGEFGSPDKCKPSVYSKMFKHACPSYFSYAFDSPSPLIDCSSDDYVITFCPESWGGEDMST